MTVQMEEEVRELVDFSPEGYLVTSFYLNVDATEFPDSDHVLKSFDSLIHEAESRRKEIEEGLSHEATESLRGDLAKMRDFFSDDFDRQDTKGVAIFSCSAFDFWHVIRLFTPVANRIEFGSTPFRGADRDLPEPRKTDRDTRHRQTARAGLYRERRRREGMGRHRGFRAASQEPGRLVPEPVPASFRQLCQAPHRSCGRSGVQTSEETPVRLAGTGDAGALQERGHGLRYTRTCRAG